MKRRKHQKNLQIHNESTHFDISDVHIEQFHYQHSQNIQNSQKQQKDQIFDPSVQPQKPQKSCAQSLKQKLEYFWVQMLNYLQFDRVLTQHEIELLKKQNYIIKTKYPDNYYLTYEQKSKKFGVSLEEITRKKMQEEQIKNKNFWNQLKRLMCCQGGNELEEGDEMLTAASQSQYFYLNKMKKKHKNSIQMTEQTLVEKPFFKMARQENVLEKDLYDKSNFIKGKANIFYEDEHNEEKNKNFTKQVNDKNSKQIDMNMIKTINKKSQKTQQFQSNNKETKIQNDINDVKEQKIENNKIYKQIKETQKVYIHKKQSLNQNLQHLEKLHIKQQDLEDQIDEVCIDKKVQNNTEINNKDSKSPTDDQKQNNQQSNNNKNLNNNTQNLNKTHEQSKKLKEQQSTNPSSPNPSFQRFTPHTINQQNPHFNLDENLQKPYQNFNSSQLDNSDNISIAQSQNKKTSDQLNKKKNQRRQKSKLPKQESLFDLVVIQNLVEDQSSLNVQGQSVDEDLGRKKHSFSSQQISKKSKKRPFNLSQFDQTINEGLEEEENKLQKSFNMEFGDNTDTIMSDSNSNLQLAKKKKARNKKLLNLREQNEKTDEVIIFDENQQHSKDNKNDQSSYAHTIDVSADLNSHAVNIKKRKKAKKLKDFNTQQEEYNFVVIEDEENTEQKINEHKIENLNKYPTSNPQQQKNQNNTIKADKKRKKKTRLREQIQKQQQFQIVDLGEIN